MSVCTSGTHPQLAVSFFFLSFLFRLFSKNGVRVALKIIKNQERYREAALIEVDVLKQTNSLDTENRLYVVVTSCLLLQ